MPVGSSLPNGDPIEQVEFVNGLAEPLWDEAGDAETSPNEPLEDQVAPSPDNETQLMPDADTSGETQLMDGEDVTGETQLMDDLPEEGPSEAADPDATIVDEGSADEDLSEADEEPEDGGEEQGDPADDAAEEEPDADADEPEPAERDPRSPLREPLQTIDVGMDRNWYESSAYRQRTRPTEHRRAYEGDAREPGSLNIWMVIAIAAVAIAAGLLIAHLILSRGSDAPADEEVVVSSQSVSRDEASRIIAGLDGWWKTGRTFDGRYWHLQGGLMETYAADGKIASQVLLDPASVERLDKGPGGIEGAGYYLRDIGFYLVDDDPDTMHAIDQDGSADEDANLLRSDPPAFVSEGGGDDAKDEGEGEESDSDPSEYLLPDSATRVYDNAELEAMSDHDLFVARNEIYARHGYVFETGELSEYFSSKSWYQPSDVFNEGEINEIERQNISAILAIEQARGSRYV